jgi:hypothetical protein
MFSEALLADRSCGFCDLMIQSSASNDYSDEWLPHPWESFSEFSAEEHVLVSEAL